MLTVLSVIEGVVAVLLIVAILLHSGKDAGFSGAFGVGGAGTKGSSVMEKNLNRFTVMLLIILVVNAFLVLGLS